MASYVMKSACRGRRPHLHIPESHYRRPALVSRLLRERNVARFIVAPDGYGKTSVALEYAETLFGFNGCFWFTSDSPCFIRDLDANSLVREILEANNAPRLVVFDDIPLLDAERAAQFSLVIDTLISVESEVIVCMTPSADVYAHLQRDRLLLGPNDLLLSDIEVGFRHKGMASSKGQSSASIGKRIAALGWPSLDNSERHFLTNVAKESLPVDVMLVVLCILVYQQGSLSEIEELAPFDSEAMLLLENRYPHLGIDAIANTFETPRFDVEDIATAYRHHLDAVSQYARCGDRDVLAYTMATHLLKRGEAVRSCAVIRRLCAQNMRASWLLEHDKLLLDEMCVLPSLDVIHSLGAQATRKPAIALARARRHMLLDNKEEAVRAVKKSAFDRDLDACTRMGCLLIVARNAPFPLRDKAQNEIEKLTGIARLDGISLASDQDASSACVVPLDVQEIAAQQKPFTQDERYWRPLGLIHCALKESVIKACGAWISCERRNGDKESLKTGASWILDALVQDGGQHNAKGSPSPHSIDAVVSFAFNALAFAEGAHTLNDVVLGLSFERARANGAVLATGTLSAHVMLWLHDCEMTLFEQRQEFDKRAQKEFAQKSDKASTHPDLYLGERLKGSQTQIGLSAPILEVRLFGKMELAFDGKYIDTSDIHRNKVKVLLALLVLANGRDVSRDVLVKSLWPNSQIETARKNLYTLWSSLREALQLPNGTCPYLIRRRGACSIDANLVRSDVQRFESVCRELFFGDASREGFADVFKDVEEYFASDLLPAEQENETICSARDEYRTRLVDALVTAASNLIAVGNAQQAVWVARFALRHEDTREDAYVMLMSAQIALGQRTAALMTFFTCKRALSEKLGLDPSPEIVMLYESLLEPGGKANRA